MKMSILLYLAVICELVHNTLTTSRSVPVNLLLAQLNIFWKKMFNVEIKPNAYV